MQLLGLWYEKGQILVFVDTQTRCDTLFADLLKVGYPGLSLHGGKDQYDRDQVRARVKRKRGDENFTVPLPPPTCTSQVPWLQ